MTRSNFVFYLTIALLSWAAYSGVFGLPLWIGGISSSLAGAESYVAYIASVQLAFAALSAIGISLLVTRIDIKKTVLAGTVLLVAANLLTAAVATELVWLLAARSLYGIAEGILLALLNVIISKQKNADRLFAFSQTMIAVFGVVLFSGVPLLFSIWGPATTFFCVAIVAVVALVLSFSLPAIDTQPKQAADQKSAAWRKDSLLVLVALGVLFVGLQGGWAFMERMGAAKGFSLGEIGRFLVIGQFVGLMSPTIAVWLGRRIGYLQVIGAGVALSGVAVFFASQALPDSLFIFSAIFFQSGTLAIVTATLVYLSMLDSSGRAASAAPGAMNLGGISGPGLAGLMLAVYGYPGIGWLVIALYLAGLILLGLAYRAAPR